jgi:hypothetical protein
MSLCEVKKVGVTADDTEYEFKIIWYSVIIIIVYHLFGLYGFYLMINGSILWQTILFSCFNVRYLLIYY